MEKYNENDGVWRTMDNGQKIFIRKGESFKDAYKRKLSMKKGNNKSLREIFKKREDNDEEIPEVKNTPETRKKILIKAYEAEENKIGEEISKIMKRKNESEMDYEGRKIKITDANRQLTDEEENRLDKLSDRLSEVKRQLSRLRK